MAFDDASLQVQVLVDTSQLSTGTAQTSAAVDAMASKIKTAFGSVAHAPEQVQVAVQQMNSELKLVAPAVERAGAAIDYSMKSGKRSLMEAREAAMLLGEELGLRLPRAMSGVIARSDLLGPALNTAFSAIAVIGFIGLAVRGAEELSNFIAKIAIFTDAEKAVSAQLLKDNTEIFGLYKQIGAQERANALIGLSAVDAAKLKIQFNQTDQALLKTNLATEQQKLATLNQERIELEKQFDVAAMATGGLEAGAGLDLSKQMEKNELAIQSTSSALVVLQKQLQLTQAKGVGEGKTEDVDAAAAASAAWKETNQKMVQGFKDREAIQKETGQALAAVSNEELQTMLAAGKRETESYLVNLKEREKGLQESAKERIKLAKDEADETLKAAIVGAKEAMKADDQRFEHQFKMGQLNEEQLITLKQKALEDEFKAEDTALQKRITELGSKELAEAKKLSDERVALEREKNDKIAALNFQLSEKIHLSLQKGFEDVINRPLDTMVQGVLMGTQRMGVAFSRLGVNIAASMIESFAKMVLKSAETWAIMEIQTLLGLKTIDAAKKAYGFKQVMRDAHKAAAAAFADVPFPANYVVAPLVFATVAALAGGASAERGAIIPADNMVLFPHAQEMVLPADISAGLQGAIRGGGMGGGEIHVHMHNHFLDGTGVQDFMDRHGDRITRTIGKKLRNMGMTPR
jgi:hypothetical protein